MNDKNFIEVLRQKREEYGVTQTKLAVACGISREYYNRIEKGKQPLNDELREVIEKQIERQSTCFLIRYLRAVSSIVIRWLILSNRYLCILRTSSTCSD